MQDKIKKIKSKHLEIVEFLQTGIWRVHRKSFPGIKGILLHVLRIFILTFRGFQNDNCILRASALTFYTFLSIVPVLALTFGISKGFGLEAMLEKFLVERFPFQEEALTQIISFAQELLEKTQGGIIAGVGITILLWTIIKVLMHIETSLNQIWKVEKARNVGRKFNDYFAFIIICPAVTLLHGSLSVFITVQVETIIQRGALIGIFSPIIFSLLRLLPYALIWIILTYIYKSFPFTDVKTVSAVIAGILAGTLFQLVQWAYIYFQVGVAQYNAVYGSFAAIPLFLVWLQISWLIVLFGAEFSYAFEKVDQYEFEPDIKNLSYFQKKLLYLTVAQLLTKNFAEEKPALNDRQISEHLAIPGIFVRHALQEMIEAEIVTDAKCKTQDSRVFQPAKDIHLYTVTYILNALEKKGKNIIFIEKSPQFQSLEKSLEELEKTIEQSRANFHLKDITVSDSI
jgi:membrane protein